MDLCSTTLIIGLVSILYVMLRSKLFYIIMETFPRDFKLFIMFMKLSVSHLYMLQVNNTVPKLFRSTVKKYPQKVAFYFEDEKWTFEQVEEYSNKIGRYFKSLGYKRGESIALLMDSRPEFVCLWLGLAKVGIVTALINTNLMSKEALAHAFKSGKAKSVIFGSRFKDVVKNVKPLMPELKMFQFNDQPSECLAEASELKSQLQGVSDTSLDADIDMGKSEETLIYIYTSGTTGLPKASIIKNSRYGLAYYLFKYGVEIEPEDVLNIPVPLYHSLGGMAGLSQCLMQGTTVVIRTKFSASSFWKDCEKYKCTVSQYIGEMARYIIAAHMNSKERPTYKLQKMYGNGMKPTTWKQFIEHFNVGQIFEFYGSTEGNFGLFNIDNKVGAVGYIPVITEPFAPLGLIKCNESGEPIRNENGFCEASEYGEPGLLLSQITNLLSIAKFDGYSDKESTNKKILKDVFRKGDSYFNSGDILVRDDHGYFYFRDRTGDTFRWKGENVSTNEVEDILSSITNKEIAVYGVEIPGSEGKAGMAAIVDPTKSLNLVKFLEDCKSHLPSYSIPIFLRIVDQIPQTGTYKIQKVELQKAAFDINVVKDVLYFLDPIKREYVEVTKDLYNIIADGKVRV